MRAGRLPVRGDPLRDFEAAAFHWVFADITVDASDFGGDPESFQTTFGPNTRFLIELEPGALRGVNAQPGGQAKSPEDPHYADLTGLWLDDRYQELTFWFDQVRGHPEKTLRFNP